MTWVNDNENYLKWTGYGRYKTFNNSWTFRFLQVLFVSCY